MYPGLPQRAYRPILNDAGEPVVLNEEEQYNAELLQRQFNEQHYHKIKNHLGFEIPITTMTQVAKRVSEQKFYTVDFANYVSLSVGEGLWATNIEQFRSFDIGGDFATGVVNTAGDSDRIAMADAGIDGINIRLFPWVKGINYSLIQMMQAARSGNFSLIESKNRSLKRNFDQGIQKVAFLGLDGQNAMPNGACLGLLNQPSIPVDTTTITQPISSMTPAQFKTFAQNIIEKYRNSSQRTSIPNRFLIPESDYNGLASQIAPDFPIKSTLQILKETFWTILGEGFEILPLAYADAQYSGLGYQSYMLYNMDPDSGIMFLPCPFTPTLAGTFNNFQYQSVAYAQFSGYLVIRPLEHLYFHFTL